MRKAIYSLCLLILSLSFLINAEAQSNDVRGRRVIADQSFYLRDRWIDSVLNDTANLSGKVRSIMTADAILKLVRGKVAAWGSITGDINNQTDLVAKIDSINNAIAEKLNISDTTLMRETDRTVINNRIDSIQTILTSQQASMDKGLLPIGGLKGYVLRKRTVTDYDVEWYPWDSTNTGGENLLEYSEQFIGVSTGQFTVPKTPYEGKTDVYINGIKIPRNAFTITVNTIQIVTAILGYGITPDDKIEIIYHSTQ